MRAKLKTTNLQAVAAVTFSLQTSAIVFAVVITLAERARSRGRDRGLERFDGDCGIAQREEKRNWFIRICLVLVRNCNWKWNWKKEIV